MALLIKADGERLMVDVPQVGQLEFLQSLVHGYIELAGLGQGSNAEALSFEGLVCNEEGKLKGLPANHSATNFAGYTSDFLVGDILFFKEGEIQ